MIMILSEDNDLSTTQVIQWLDFFKKAWIRINISDKINFEFSGTDINFILDSASCKLSEIHSVWFRRGFFSFDLLFSTEFKIFDDFLTTEYKNLIEYVYYKLSEKKCINNIQSYAVNKLIISSIARTIGLKTPEDLIFSNSSFFQKKQNENYITKSISGRGMFSFDNFTIYNYTRLIDFNKVKGKHFFPSLIQNYIEKKYELRIFYLEDEFYSMAIFSQKDKTTTIDFRNYNSETPNRTVPFLLPESIKKGLIELTKKIGINSGSIDMIVTPENDYIFLEVNPVGQFGMTSYPCNYNLEKRIAEFL